jgi:hypothetical protein
MDGLIVAKAYEEGCRVRRAATQVSTTATPDLPAEVAALVDAALALARTMEREVA